MVWLEKVAGRSLAAFDVLQVVTQWEAPAAAAAGIDSNAIPRVSPERARDGNTEWVLMMIFPSVLGMTRTESIASVIGIPVERGIVLLLMFRCSLFYRWEFHYLSGRLAHYQRRFNRDLRRVLLAVADHPSLDHSDQGLGGDLPHFAQRLPHRG